MAEDLDEKEITLQRSYITRRNAKILKGEEHFAVYKVCVVVTADYR